ncbi:MAG: L,D-transpeptidase family protein [Bacteroidetes bacterium]|nr:L,D-transpeptidase family protein [Bacteroidota bacterium]
MKTTTLLIFTIILFSFAPQDDFLTEQKRYPRVRTAFEDKEDKVIKTLEHSGIKVNELNILIMAFKAEERLNIYAKNRTDTNYKKLLSYKICSNSGVLGPKRKEGDAQVPEGFYHIDRFNPASTFYLSLGLNYPNSSDRKLSKHPNLGGDIFIHGNCVTIGCMPMTNTKIKEIYLFAIHARNNGQLKIPVYIFPFKMTEENFNTYKNNGTKIELIDFWTNLKTGYDKFIRDKKELEISVDREGNYIY